MSHSVHSIKDEELNISFSVPRAVSIGIQSDAVCSLAPEQELLLHAHLPGLRRLVADSREHDLELVHLESSEPSFEKDRNRFILHDTWNNITARDLHHLLYSLAREQFLNQEIYSVHSSCVRNKKDEKQVLIVGHSGAGKSSTALELILQADWQIASGNKTLVAFDTKNEMYVQGGTTTMTVRKNQGQHYAQMLGDEIHCYGNRLAFSLSPERYVAISEQPISAIVVVQIQDGLQEQFELGNRTALNTLYPLFLDTVNADTILTKRKGLYRGETPDSAARTLAQSLEIAVSEIPILTMAGPVSFLAEQIQRL